MDININTLPQQKPAAVASVTASGLRQSADTSIKSTTDAGNNAQASPVSNAAAPTSSAPNPGHVAQAVNQLNEHAQAIQKALLFSVDQSTGILVVKVIDADSKKLIVQLPAEAALKLAQDITAQQNKAFTMFNSKV